VGLLRHGAARAERTGVIPAFASATLVAVRATPPPAEAAGAVNCTSDVFTIDGRAVTVSLCSPAEEALAPRRREGRAAREARETPEPRRLALRETFSSGGESFSRSLPVEFVDGTELSRTIDDIPLDKLGIAKTLHLTIGYRPGTVRLEHALLVPGAIPLR
jgi:hypothetical protein